MLAIILVVGPPRTRCSASSSWRTRRSGSCRSSAPSAPWTGSPCSRRRRRDVVRDGEVRDVAVTEVVADDVLDARRRFPGRGGRRGPARRGPRDRRVAADRGGGPRRRRTSGDEVLSGSFVAAGTGRYRATRVGTEAYAAKLAQDARRFTLTRSELRSGHRPDPHLRHVRDRADGRAAVRQPAAVCTTAGARPCPGAVAGTVAMVPEGLVLLTSLGVRGGRACGLARRRVLVQELPAVEGLARVDVLCIDKTGTLTEGRLTVQRVDPMAGAAGVERGAGRARRQRRGAERHDARDRRAVPRGSRRVGADRLRAVLVGAQVERHGAFGDRGAWILGAPDVLLIAARAPTTSSAPCDVSPKPGNRVVLLAAAAALDRRHAPVRHDARRRGRARRSRARRTPLRRSRTSREQGVTVKVISGDDPRTVGAIARTLGLAGADDPDRRTRASRRSAGRSPTTVEAHTVFGRVTPAAEARDGAGAPANAGTPSR